MPTTTKNINIDFETLTTFQIAYNIYADVYNEEEKKLALSEISKRDAKIGNPLSSVPEGSAIRVPKQKPPLKGSKTEKIYDLLAANIEPTEVFRQLKAKKVKIHPSEVYRVGRLYWPEKFK